MGTDHRDSETKEHEGGGKDIPYDLNTVCFALVLIEDAVYSLEIWEMCLNNSG